MHGKIDIIAPAKVNLFLHITGKRDDGYHLLQSLNSFTDFGDNITLQESNDYNLTIDGEFAVPADDNNLVTKAVRSLAQATDKQPNIAIHVTKNIPFGAGLGGGSSDAASVIKALLQFWNISLPPEKIQLILRSLGADVPACYHAQACLMEGIGDVITPIENFPPHHAVLVYPNQTSHTENIFKNFSPPYSDKITTMSGDLAFLRNQKNDLKATAAENVKVIDDVLRAIEQQQECFLSRMTGSGSACFGLFKNQQSVIEACERIKATHKDWWVKACILS
jgi:4-diphosphocytidyl-2-C-methyl-D-erythritol kinase